MSGCSISLVDASHGLMTPENVEKSIRKAWEVEAIIQTVLLYALKILQTVVEAHVMNSQI